MEIFWANDYQLYEYVLNDMLEHEDMRLIDLEYHYGDMDGNPIPRHPEIEDDELYKKVLKEWAFKIMHYGTMADEMKLNYEQLIRVMTERNGT